MTMSDRIKIQAICNLQEGFVFPCSGYIEILWVKNKEAYATWQLFNEGGFSMGASSRRYYLGDEIGNTDKIVEMVLYNIKKCRSDRKYLFSDVKIADTDLGIESKNAESLG